MNNPRIVRKLKEHRKKAISPVIATIILIAVALIMALVVGVFAFGLFTSNAHSITIKNAQAYGVCPTGLTTTDASAASIGPGDSCLVVSFDNPGSAVPGAVGGSLVGGGVSTTVSFANGIGGGVFVTAVDLTTAGNAAVTGVQYDLQVNLPSAQPLTATIIAQ